MLRLTKKEAELYKGLVTYLQMAAELYDDLGLELYDALEAAFKNEEDTPADREELSLLQEAIGELWMSGKIRDWQMHL